jgi:hypothetical protein
MRYRLMRTTLLFCVSFLAPLACHWGGAGTPSRLSNSTANLPVNTTVSLETPATPSGFTNEDFAKHIQVLKRELKKKLPHATHGNPQPDFSFVVQSPFVVIGDEPTTVVQDHAKNTVKWAVDRLKLDFFTSDPKDILDIWLFKNADSYQKHVALLFGEKPSTPFGYYSSAHKALIMNIETGGGTLVHEIVHPFIEANFPACPPWLNEGLGSLYEQCGDANGHIRGFTNWRLPVLQQAIRLKNVPSFAELTAHDSSGFYSDDKGVNYAQARYLCYYLQDKGLLIKFYQTFLARQKADPTGYKTLQEILGEADMQRFKLKWETYVLGLRQGYEVTVQ